MSELTYQDLLDLIEAKSDKLESVLDQIERGLPIDFLRAAEKTGDEGIVMLVADHATHHGFNLEIPCENLLLLAVIEGFAITASFIADINQNNAEYLSTVLSESGQTAAEIAREKGMIEVAEEIEGYLEKCQT